LATNTESNNAGMDNSWVIMEVFKNYYALPTKHVTEMVVVPETLSIPDAQSYVRGVVDIRGNVYPLVGFRERLGLSPLRTEADAFCKMMDDREQDHRVWLGELENSVRKKSDFKLATDPHMCAFGKWFDTFKSEDKGLMQLVSQFDHPHKAIHGIAHEAIELGKEGDFDSSMELINSTRDTKLAEMIRLFTDVRDHVRNNNREIAVVIKKTPECNAVAIAVDAVISVESLGEKDNTNFHDTIQSEMVSEIRQRQQSNEKVLTIDMSKILIE
jgi:chemotaxis signal transduction protein